MGKNTQALSLHLFNNFFILVLFHSPTMYSHFLCARPHPGHWGHSSEQGKPKALPLGAYILEGGKIQALTGKIRSTLESGKVLRRKLKRIRVGGSVVGACGHVYVCESTGRDREEETEVSLRRWHVSKNLLEWRKWAMQTFRERTFRAEETANPKALTVGVSNLPCGAGCYNAGYRLLGQSLWRRRMKDMDKRASAWSWRKLSLGF